MDLDANWVHSLLAAIKTRTTREELVALYRRWQPEIEGHAERERIIEAFANRKGELNGRI